MIILDYLFYYITYWFDQRNYQLTWSTSKQRSSYVVGLAMLAILAAVAELIDYTVLKYQNFHQLKIIFIIVGLANMKLLDYIYIDKKRYDSINPSVRFKILKGISDKKKSIFAVIIIVIFFVLPFLILILYVPFGMNRS